MFLTDRKMRKKAMTDFAMMFCNLSFTACEIVSAYYYGDCVDRLLKKDRRWINSLLGCISIMLILTLIFTWLPGRIGYEVTLIDEELITLKDGALFQNLALMCVAQAFAIVLAVVKYLWAVIRRKQKFSFPFLAVEFLFAAAFVTAAVYLAQNDTVIPFKEDTGTAYIVTALIAGAGILLFFWPADSGNGENRTSAQSGKKEKNRKETVAREDLARFAQLMERKNQLTQAGDYAALIPLLTEATGWKVGKEQKVRIWNYLGMAYEQIGSNERAEECYRTAMKMTVGIKRQL